VTSPFGQNREKWELNREKWELNREK